MKGTINIDQFQSYVAKYETDKGITKKSNTEKCRLLSESVSDLFEKIRYSSNCRISGPPEETKFDQEIFEVILNLCVVANGQSIHIAEILNKYAELIENVDAIKGNQNRHIHFS